MAEASFSNFDSWEKTTQRSQQFHIPTTRITVDDVIHRKRQVSRTDCISADGVVSSPVYVQMNETSDAVNKRRPQIDQVSGSARKAWNSMSNSSLDA